MFSRACCSHFSLLPDSFSYIHRGVFCSRLFLARAQASRQLYARASVLGGSGKFSVQRGGSFLPLLPFLVKKKLSLSDGKRGESFGPYSFNALSFLGVLDAFCSFRFFFFFTYFLSWEIECECELARLEYIAEKVKWCIRSRTLRVKLGWTSEFVVSK